MEAVIFTEGETVEEIKENIVDALSCYFNKIEDIPKIIRLHFVREEIFTYASNAKGCFA